MVGTKPLLQCQCCQAHGLTQRDESVWTGHLVYDGHLPRAFLLHLVNLYRAFSLLLIHFVIALKPLYLYYEHFQTFAPPSKYGRQQPPHHTGYILEYLMCNECERKLIFVNMDYFKITRDD